MEVNDVLNERGSRYGDFAKHAEISQALEDVARATPGWTRLSPAQKESLKLQWHKQARILNGDPNYADSWVDISGYAMLVSNILGTGVSHTDALKAQTAAPVNAVFPKAPEPVAPVSPTVAAPAAPSAQKPAAPSPISPIGTEAKK